MPFGTGIFPPRLVTVHQGQEGVDPASYSLAAYGYGAAGNLAGTSYINQVTHGYTYDTLNRLTDLTVGRAGTGWLTIPLQAYGYTLNAARHRTTISELGGRTISHTYDHLYRLTGESIAGSTLLPTGQVIYTYDKVGNRLTRSSSGSLNALLPSQAHTFNVNDQLDHHSYDANGNNTQSEVGTDNPTGPASANDVYSFDNRLIRRTRSDGKIIDLLYNSDGDRVAKWVQQGGLNESIHHYLVDRQNHTGYAQVVEESDGSGNLVARHLYGHDLIAFDSWNDRSNGVPILRSIPERRWYHYDGLGSVRALSNDDGVVTEAYTYDAYGCLIAHQLLDPATGGLVLQDLTNFPLLTENRYLFTGEQWDTDLGMYFLRARYLVPNLGRFHNSDAYEGRNGEPLTLHKYLYTHANPANGIDPSGHVTIKEVATTFAVSGSINAAFGLGFRIASGTQDPKSFWSDIGTDFIVGGVTAPVGGLISRVFGPVIRAMLRPALRAIGSLQRITATGLWRTGGRRLVVNISRWLFNTNKSYPRVGSTWLGRMLKRLFPNIAWDQHHVFIQQSWFRAGGPNQIFENLLENRGLQRLGNGYWNLLPIPRSLNAALGANTAKVRFLTSMFATAVYSTIVFGPAQAIAAITDD